MASPARESFHARPLPHILMRARGGREEYFINQTARLT
jgi:hypothetical protein